MRTAPNRMTQALGFLGIAGGTVLAVWGMLTLSLPHIVAGATLWALGLLLGERSARR